MTNYLKYKIHCKYLKYLKHGKRNCDYIELQISIEVSEDISKRQEQYYDLLSQKVK